MGFAPTLCNKNLWILKEETNSLVYISIYVDGVLISIISLCKYLDMLKIAYNLKIDKNLTQ